MKVRNIVCKNKIVSLLVFISIVLCCFECRNNNKNNTIDQPSNVQKNNPKPEGNIVDGIRVITRSENTLSGDIVVYRGETVKVLVNDFMGPTTIQIPDLNLTKELAAGEILEVEFKVKDIGTFPVITSADNDSQITRIVVMQYESSGKAQFSELTATEAKSLIAQKNPLILDVRTKREYSHGHIVNAVLIPVQGLAKRLKEIEQYRHKDVLIYCRSGNRSTVASQILIKHGFTKLYNMRPGIKGWVSKGYTVTK